MPSIAALAFSRRSMTANPLPSSPVGAVDEFVPEALVIALVMVVPTKNSVLVVSVDVIAVRG